MKFLGKLIRPHWLLRNLHSSTRKLSLFTPTISATPMLNNLPFSDSRLSALSVSVSNLRFTQYCVIYFILPVRVAVDIIPVVSFIIKCWQRLFDKGVSSQLVQPRENNPHPRIGGGVPPKRGSSSKHQRLNSSLRTFLPPYTYSSTNLQTWRNSS